MGEDKLLVVVFTLQALVNLVSFGLGLGMMIIPLTRPLPPKFVYLEPVFVFIYPLLGVLALWSLSGGRVGERVPVVYFGIGVAGSLIGLADQMASPRGPDWLGVSLPLFWLLTSLAGLYLVRSAGYLPAPWTAPAMALFILSAFLGAAVSYMVAEDYYYHAIIPRPPENANVTTARPIWVDNASG